MGGGDAAAAAAAAVMVVVDRWIHAWIYGWVDTCMDGWARASVWVRVREYEHERVGARVSVRVQACERKCECV